MLTKKVGPAKQLRFRPIALGKSTKQTADDEEKKKGSGIWVTDHDRLQRPGGNGLRSRKYKLQGKTRKEPKRSKKKNGLDQPRPASSNEKKRVTSTRWGNTRGELRS